MPRLLMLDEPLGSLDRVLRDQLLTDLRQLLPRLHQTAIYVTHDQLEAFAIADRVVLMNEGGIEQEARRVTSTCARRRPSPPVSWVSRTSSPALCGADAVPVLDTPLGELHRGRFPHRARGRRHAGRSSGPKAHARPVMPRPVQSIAFAAGDALTARSAHADPAGHARRFARPGVRTSWHPPRRQRVHHTRPRPHAIVPLASSRSLVRGCISTGGRVWQDRGVSQDWLAMSYSRPNADLEEAR